MAPVLWLLARQAPVLEPPDASSDADLWNWRAHAKDEDLILESWSQGFVVGALGLMACITLANLRRGVTLHKLILAEQLMALTHGTFCFMDFHGYGWYLSSTAALLYLSYILHNYVAWLKIKPFFEADTGIFKPNFRFFTPRIYLSTLALTVPVILFQISDNFRYFNGYGGWYVVVRPYEPLMRDPWWIFCNATLFYVIAQAYAMPIFTIIRKSPRFAILFVSIFLALVFTGLDVAASIHSFIGDTDGINPFWKLSLVFKCLTDAILLDDFKTELRRLGVKRIKRDEKRRESVALTLDDDDRNDSDEEAAKNFSNGTIDATRTYSNGSPRRPFQPGQHKNSDLENSEQVEFMSALNDTTPEMLGSEREHRRSSQQRAKVGQGGAPAPRLPKLFAAIKPAKKSKVHDFAEDAPRNNSIFTEDTQSSDDIAPEMQERSHSKQRRRDPIDEVKWEDDSLQRAREEQARTIEELKRRQSSAASVQKPNIADTAEQPKPVRKHVGKDFWDRMMELDDDSDEASDEAGPSSKRFGSD